MEDGADYFEPLVLESPVERMMLGISRFYPQPVINVPWQSALQGLQFSLIDEQILNNLRRICLPIEPNWTEVLKGVDVRPKTSTASDEETNSEVHPDGPADDEIEPSP